MNVWGVVRQLNFWQFTTLAKMLLANPLLAYPTLKATKRALYICDIHYKKTHHKNGRANAFRHAIWSLLVCKETLKITKTEAKSMIWAQKITDLHEKLAPNAPLETAMDLHNNAMGIQFFSTLVNATEEEVILFLKNKTNCAIKVTSSIEIADYPNDLVYILENE
ncbi:hypothetical protein D1816_15350 [Aquimarina sp. AD10]|uniref:DUF6973 domain-containing protein n=1 Tax=Aquimarina sp. AD10 TaxID=1714849 RepID=UPI000E4A8EE9|nr:hypothetical protein [Aquimarina sp. AD10]AXT61671.1 hypothetical protein D1816_15350 [Aquimarina sp. AD10]RKN00980.1 hypothetical protein D7033_06415 [Aquimarina sp. AD10]